MGLGFGFYVFWFCSKDLVSVHWALVRNHNPVLKTKKFGKWFIWAGLIGSLSFAQRGVKVKENGTELA